MRGGGHKDAEATRPCLQCGGPTRIWRGKKIKFCSPRCFYSWRIANRRIKSCTVCGKSFSAWGRTCSRECGGIFRRKRTQRPCRVCGKEFEYHTSRGIRVAYCSRECYAKRVTTKIELKCANCNMKFSRTPAFIKRRRTHFCTTECRILFYKKQRHPLWRGGETSDRGSEWYLLCRRIRKRDEYKCQGCGMAQRKGDKLSIDHIIPFRLVMENAEVNLVSLCRSCHSKKTQAERLFLRGDVLGFIQRLRCNGWNMDRVGTAIRYWGEKK